MEKDIEQKISGLVASQFPSFYQEEGPRFIQFVKAYYEWMEEEGGIINQSRNIYNYGDLDETLDKFLYYFQKKYLYGIPFDVIINKRLLLKHTLDAYRSKGSLQCFKLLFRLIYDKDMDVYLPGRDLLRPSDNYWIEKKYLEVSSNGATDLVGKKIQGTSSGTTAIVESYTTEPVNGKIVTSLYISNINPRGGDFNVGEKIIDYEDRNSANIGNITTAAPKIFGSLDRVIIAEGGQNFKVGDVLEVVHRRITNNQVISAGKGAQVKVTEIRQGRGSLVFDLVDGGFGYTIDAIPFIYRGVGDTTGRGASFEVGSLANVQSVEYNTDIFADYYDVTFDAAAYGFPGAPTANSSNTFAEMLTFTTDQFGTIASLDRVRGGNNYTNSATVFAKSVIVSDTLDGTITYDNTSNAITGSGTSFDSFFESGMTVVIQANTSLSNTEEYHVVATVTNATHMTLYGKPTQNSTASATHKLAPEIIKANFAVYEDPAPVDCDIDATPSVGNGVIATVKAITSGKGYRDGESVTMYRSGGISAVNILYGGTGYTNGQYLIFTGGDPFILPVGTVTTNSTGGITSTTITENGSGLRFPPMVTVQSANGSGAILTSSISKYDTTYAITGQIVKGGIGRKRGYWKTTDSFLNADKYVQDSYFYQDYSYQIKASVTIDKYRDILYDTFHIAGSAMFGQYLLVDEHVLDMEVVYTQNTPTTNVTVWITSDMTDTHAWLTADVTTITTDVVSV